MIVYDDACAWLQEHFCCKYSDYKTACKGCPFSGACYKDFSDISNIEKRTAIFENSIIAEVENYKRSCSK